MKQTLFVFVALTWGAFGTSLLQAAAVPPGQASWLNYGHVQYQAGKYAEAEQAYLQAVDANAQDATAWQGLGNARVQQQRPQEALQAYERCLQLKPENPALSAYVERMKASLGTAATEAEPVDEEALAEELQEARSLYEARELPAALKIFDEGAKQQPQEAAWARGQAETHYALGEFDQAREAMQRARRLAPGDEGLQRLQERYYHDGLENEGRGGAVLPPLWRSVLLPGWGQAYNGQKDKALRIGGITLGLLAATAISFVATSSALEEYRALGPGTPAADFDAAFAKADTLAVTNQILGICFYGAYAYNLFDAGAHARPAATAQVPGSVRLALLEARF